MTAHTQAQIEVAQLLDELRNPCGIQTQYTTAMYNHAAEVIEKLLAALTAAAEVGWPPNGLVDNLVASATEEDSKVEHYPMGKPVITAAAEAGEPKYKTWQDADREDRNITIERCAQAADRLANKYRNSIAIDVVAALQEAAAAIRAMKEEG